MTAAVLRLPVTQEAADRMAMQARREAIRTACLDVLAHHAWHSREAIEDAWVSLALYGDEHEREVAQKQVDRMAAETPAPAYRLSDVIAGAVLVLAAGYALVAGVMALGGW